MVLTLTVAGCTLAVMYLVAAALRLLVAVHVPWVRREYALSIPVCLMLSLNSLSVIWIRPVATPWGIFGRASAALAVIIIYVRPAVRVLQVSVPLEPQGGEIGPG